MLVQHKSGLLAELYVAGYFVEEGWDLYWPHAPQSRADFVVSKGTKTLTVQCKKATWSKAGPYEYLQARLSSRNKESRPKYEEGDFDLIAFTDMNSIWLTEFSQIKDMTSVCLGSTNPDYKPYTKYDAMSWKVK